VLVAPDGSLYVVGTSAVGSARRISVVHLHANGQLDTDFGTNGHYIVPSIDATASAAVFAANGDILVAATRHEGGSNDNFAVCRVRGASVAQFGNTGLSCITLAFDLGGALQDTARDIVLLAGGRIALIGSADAGNNTFEAAIGIIHDDGTPDVVFNPGGKLHWLPAGYATLNLYAGVRKYEVIHLVGDGKEINSTRLGAFSAFVNTETGQHLNDTLDYLGDADSQAFYRDVVVDNDPNKRVYAAGGVLKDGKFRGVVTRVQQSGEYDPDWANGNGYAAIYAGESVQLTKLVKQADARRGHAAGNRLHRLDAVRRALQRQRQPRRRQLQHPAGLSRSRFPDARPLRLRRGAGTAVRPAGAGGLGAGERQQYRLRLRRGSPPQRPDLRRSFRQRPARRVSDAARGGTRASARAACWLGKRVLLQRGSRRKNTRLHSGPKRNQSAMEPTPIPYQSRSGLVIASSPMNAMRPVSSASAMIHATTQRIHNSNS
jgi:hypothetical protein